MKKKVITLAIVPTFAMTGCGDTPDEQRTKVNPPQRTYIQQTDAANQTVYTQKADGTYYRCANGKVVIEGQSCNGGGSSTFIGTSRSADKDEQTTKRGGFGSKPSKSGG